ncbi:antA/AntB antirepressor family protein [Sutcliffiella horikoshii]|uniref:antA/AntB antirepressor family protein n=1 Tax=Sutcliffiella horikoshii TaxID=79883 RepID=UPI00203E2334|nr:antA/AntB antirepressor family protein [Sutcliffiella horikoshii]MCM3618716.1 antA/AntB antirepressor family protein [Sutcliffiella horikoshii]
MENLKVIADEFFPVYESNTGEKLVNARDLHTQLVVGKDFTSWVKDRIQKYGFVENEDYVLTVTKTGERQNVLKHDYWLALNTGKEIAMVQNNEMGRAIRKYFIEVEKRFKESQPKTQAEMLLQYAEQMVKNERENAERDQKIRRLETGVETLAHNLTAVPDHRKVIDNVNEYARWTRVGHNEVYNSIYAILKAQHGIDVKTRVENERRKINADYYQRTGKLYAESTLKQKVNGIDVMVRMGCLNKFNSILTGFLTKAKVPTS